MSLLDQLLSVIVPHDCLSCGSEGALLCPSCTDGLLAAVERCYRCQKPNRPRSVRAAYVYSGTAKELVWKLKFAGAQAAVEQMATQMLLRLRATSDTIVVPVPTATSRVRRRGYDQARLLARQLSRESQLRYVPCLSRITQSQQVGASREQRLKQLSSAFHAQKTRLVHGKHVILIDDVVTTGATLEAATTVLRAAGAGRIDALVFAQA